jgi:AraC-like DNA-binding protein
MSVELVPMPPMAIASLARHARSPALREAVLRHAPDDGVHETAIDGLRLHRHSRPVEIGLALYQPSMCLLVQGSKRVLLGEQVHVYDTMHHLVASRHLPATGQVLMATPEEPYLCVELAIEASEVAELLLEIGHPVSPPDAPPAQGMYTEDTEPHLLETTLRLLQQLDSTRDARTLGPAVKREIVYRLLTAPSGWRLARSAAVSGHERRMGRVISVLRERYREPLRIAQLAQVAHMSESSLQQHFKAVTAMTPLQYQKKLRLLEARRLLMSGSVDAATAAHTVGYESPSQFSREYTRLFGAPPRRDQARLRAVDEQARPVRSRG